MQLAAHSQMVSMVWEVLSERDTGLLIGPYQSPLLAARTQRTGESEGAHGAARHLNRLTADILEAGHRHGSGGPPRGRGPPPP
ncbi:hypothetical protein Snoj_26520 [Streptomyces nojiriensis]|uniref:Uncharacterized protein n=1 Tax=Streptomyces nojiriensis TaxID=66374 RepID=A0ABQ3SKV5_9ACTN|nr:hypothetical protein GCM10010205_70120 [Streptomyces nojiriensis]GHI68734.1 hypothetical protein Snoj_26520 [Streptomyces nojiriensis]